MPDSNNPILLEDTDVIVRILFERDLNYFDKDESRQELVFKLAIETAFNFSTGKDGDGKLSFVSLRKLGELPNASLNDLISPTDKFFSITVKELKDAIAEEMRRISKSPLRETKEYLEKEFGYSIEWTPLPHDCDFKHCDPQHHSHASVSVLNPKNKQQKNVVRRALWNILRKKHPELAYSNKQSQSK